MARSEPAAVAPPEVLKVRMAVAVAHHTPGGGPQEFAAGAVYSLPRGEALTWHCTGWAELVDAYTPDPEELRAAGRAALRELEGERLRSGMDMKTWEKVPWTARRLERLAAILTTGEPMEAA